MSLTFGELAKNSFCDFFHVPDDYPDRIKTYPNAKIKQQEAVKTRKVYAALVSIVNGAAFVVPSHGGSLVICAWAARRLFVATHKLKFIKAELTIRKLELRRFMHRDWMIPVAVALASIAISCGVDFGLHHFIPTGHPFLMTGDNGSLSAAVVTPSGATATSTVHSVVNEGFTTGPQAPVVSNMMGYVPTSEVQQSLAVIQHPITAAADVGKGFLSEWQHIFGHGQGNAVDLMSGDSGSQGLAAATGFVSGEHVAESIQRSMAVLIGSQSLQWMSYKLDFESIRPRVSQQLACKRLPWSTGVLCDRCESPIQSGKFFREYFVPCVLRPIIR
jgi:hypothetical protein